MLRITQRLLVTTLLAAGIVLGACDGRSSPTAPDVGPQPVATLYKGHVVDPFGQGIFLDYRLITSADDLADAWTQFGISGPIPALNFSGQSVIVASGWFSLGCEILNIDRATFTQTDIELDVTLGRDGNCVCLTAIAGYAHVVSVPRFDGEPNLQISESPQQPACSD